jgi:hypothetical protein
MLYGTVMRQKHRGERGGLVMKQFELNNGGRKEIVFADVITVRNGALELQQYDREIAGAPLRTTSIYSDGFWASIHQTTAMFGEANISSRWCLYLKPDTCPPRPDCPILPGQRPTFVRRRRSNICARSWPSS